jgi:hypothetical protein
VSWKKADEASFYGSSFDDAEKNIFRPYDQLTPCPPLFSREWVTRSPPSLGERGGQGGELVFGSGRDFPPGHHLMRRMNSIPCE